MKIVIKAPAKVNLSLDVLNKRPDGYHELRSVFQTISLYDVVTIEGSTNSEDTMEVLSKEGKSLSEEETGIPTDGRNLMMKAVRKLRTALENQKSEKQIPAVHMTLQKEIPSQAGLGGGSSDAAAVLYGLNRLFDLQLKQEELLKVAATIGADVPFLLVGGTAECKGIGEIITPLKPVKDLPLLIIKPRVGASTKEIFETLDQKSEYDHPNTDEIIKALSEESLDFQTAFCGLKNVLQQVTEAFCPEVREICAEMKNSGAIQALMSGSGTACFGIFESEKARNSALKSIQKEYPQNCYFSVNSTQVGLEEITL